MGGRKASLQPPSTVRSNWLPHARLCSKKQLRVGAARRLCSGDRPGRSTWLDRYVLALLTSAGRAELPPPAREAGPSWPRRACQTSKRSPVAGSDDAEGGRAASGRCGGFAQSCGRCRFFDRGRSNRCWRHQQASCGRLYCVNQQEASPTSTPWINQASYCREPYASKPQASGLDTIPKLSPVDLIPLTVGRLLREKTRTRGPGPVRYPEPLFVSFFLFFWPPKPPKAREHERPRAPPNSLPDASRR